MCVWFRVAVCVLLTAADVQCQMKDRRLKEGDICHLSANRQGLCAPIDDCDSVTELFKNHRAENRTSLREVLADDLCGFDDTRALVCCPELDVSADELVNDCTCGVSLSDRVIGGRQADMFEFPWMALVRTRFNQTINFGYQCGGTLISLDYVLTAAHCLANYDYNKFTVRLGEHDIRNETDYVMKLWKKVVAPEVQDFRIAEAFIHPLYNPDTYHNDIALIRLDRTALLKPTVSPICLPIGVNMNASNQFVIVGWGGTEKEVLSRVPYTAALRVMPNRECDPMHKTKRITYKQLCADASKSDAYPGDSGGPLQQPVWMHDDIKMVQFGIVSFGDTRSKLPGVYTRISYYVHWILQKINQNSTSD